MFIDEKLKLITVKQELFFFTKREPIIDRDTDVDKPIWLMYFRFDLLDLHLDVHILW